MLIRTMISILLLPISSRASTSSECHNIASSGMDRSLHFADPDTPGYDFFITTGWQQYSRKLGRALNATGFTLLPREVNNSSVSCGWKMITDVWVNGLHHGRLSFRETELSGTISPDTVQIRSDRVGKLYPTPIEAPVKNVVWILRNTAPIADLTILIAELSSPFLVLGLLVLPIYFLSRWRTKQKEAQESADIELTSLSSRVSDMAQDFSRGSSKPPNYSDLTEYFEHDLSLVDLSGLSSDKSNGMYPERLAEQRNQAVPMQWAMKRSLPVDGIQ